MSELRDRGGAASVAPPPAGNGSSMASRTRLRAALDREVEAIGQAWAQAKMEALRNEGRPIAGGWPGTMSEARARVSVCARSASRSAEADLETLARRAYVVAKATWLSRTAPDADE
ncbi:MAG: hypothetical protein IPI67_25375 [Myxococcales bacterium]|nr:hypothetical protein [Myxococcales bacterium]